ncbi:E4 SUMO-protein ligase PIAL1-like [Mangifera indica]|uniref:E4 SUMO-protein ligase PIAL1-like n=1 Tax=Mangifera indica TaxID=29780 RepID=UPI001CFA330A|nr:E4 SUMO-protein ligase PIAL1-like [Mangifera indica]
MVQVLREVGKNVVDVIISSDGSWKADLESDDNMNQAHDKILSGENEGLEQQDPPGVQNSCSNVIDLTEADNEIDAMIYDETEDRKPILTDLQSQPVPTNITRPSELNNTVGVNQNVVSQREDDFWTGILYSVGGISVPATANFMMSPLLPDAISPVITDAISHALNQETEALGYNNLTTPVIQSQDSAPNDMQLQQSQFVNNHEYGRLSPSRNINRTPIAIQALPAQSLTPSPQQRSGTNFNFVTPNGSSLASQRTLSVGHSYSSSSLVSQTAPCVRNGYSDMEQQQQFSRSPINSVLGPDIDSSSLLHQSAAKVVGLPALRLSTGAYQASSGLPTENQSLHQQQTPNMRMSQSMSQSPRMTQLPSPLSRTPTQQGSAPGGVGHIAGNGSTQRARGMVSAPVAGRISNQMTRQPPTVPVQVQTSRNGPTNQVNAEGARASVGEQRVNTGGLLQQVRAENLAESPSEQNWQPTGRMRGSLSGRAYSAALSQLMIQPTQPTQVARSLSNPTSLSTAPPHLQRSSLSTTPPHLRGSSLSTARPHLQGSSLSTAPPHLQKSSLSTALPHLQGYLSNSRKAHIPQVQNNPNTETDLGKN